MNVAKAVLRFKTYQQNNLAMYCRSSPPQVLLTVCNKYDMPALLSRVGIFLQANKQQLNGDPASQHFAWKWITLADKAGLAELAQACISSCFSSAAAAAVMGSCKKEVLAGLSPATCCHLLAALAQHRSAAMQPGMVYCSTCRGARLMRAVRLGPGMTPVAAFGTPAGAAVPGAMLRCQTCQQNTTFNLI